MFCQSLLTAKWLSFTQLYLYIYILFHYGLSQDIGYSCLCYTVGPCCSPIIYTSWYLPSLNYQFNPLPVPITLGNHKSALYDCKSASALQISSFVPYFRFHMSVISHNVCLSLSYLLSMITSGCTHAAANGIILLFLWLSSIPLYIHTVSSLSVHLPMDI